MVIGPFMLCALTIFMFFVFSAFILTDKGIDLKDAIVASIVTLIMRETVGVIHIMVSDIYRNGRPREDKNGDGKPDGATP